MSGGAIYLSGESSLFIEESTFSKNSAEKSGGAISGDSFKILEISKGSRFFNNSAKYTLGDAIFANNPSEYIRIFDKVEFVS